MATVHIALGWVNARAFTGATMPVLSAAPEAVDTVSSSGTSAQASLTGAPGQVWSVTALGNVWVAFGSNPTAAADSGWLIAAGQTREFSVSAADEKIAVKDA